MGVAVSGSAHFGSSMPQQPRNHEFDDMVNQDEMPHAAATQENPLNHPHRDSKPTS